MFIFQYLIKEILNIDVTINIAFFAILHKN